jgi:lipoprotein-anchoring transpeptidase ErfK/SrfK
MQHRSFIFLAVFVAVLIFGAVGAYAYDSSQDDKVANGITVAGVDLGGLNAAEARREVSRELSEPLTRPVVVTARGKKFTLSADDANLRADVGGMVNSALERSRDGNIISRVVRDVRGAEENVDVPASVSYDRQAVQGLVQRVRRSLDQPAQDAKLNLPSLTKVREKAGFSVQTGKLHRRIESTLTVTGADDRQVGVPMKKIQPKVTRAQLVSKYPTLLVVERSTFQLKLYKNLKLTKAYTVAIGADGFSTPAGTYHIENKGVNVPWSVPNKAWAGSKAGQVIPGGSPENPLKARWLGIFAGAGIHGTDEVGSLGSRASHGCVRMAIPDVIELYPQVPVRTPIFIGG